MHTYSIDKFSHVSLSALAILVIATSVNSVPRQELDAGPNEKQPVEVGVEVEVEVEVERATET